MGLASPIESSIAHRLDARTIVVTVTNVVASVQESTWKTVGHSTTVNARVGAQVVVPNKRVIDVDIVHPTCSSRVHACRCRQ
jgi:hypothetical protein